VRDLRISVVLPTRDRCGLLPRTLAPLLEDPEVHEVVVADDGSTDGTPELLRAMAREFPRLRTIRLGGGGPARARQRGALAASGDLLLFLEDDVHGTAGLAARHRDRQATHENLVLVGYTPVDLPPGRSAGDAAVRLYAREYERVCESWEREPDRLLLHLYGGHFSVRRHHALSVGLISERFPERCHEDQDFGLRCHRAGLRARFDRDLIAWHRYRRDIPGFLSDARCRGAGKFRVHQLHPDLVGPFVAAAWWRDLPRPVAALVRATARPRLRVAILSVLRALATLSVASGSSAVEQAALQVARRILLLDGGRAASWNSADQDLRVRGRAVRPPNRVGLGDGSYLAPSGRS
jgi:glycosyltransferase involved in cell wall biosynthesis